ncbi:hypothetical protein HanRHA438_Chr15g0688991 [Helianthus annuus]|uniref:Uncharacterized protein n=1 Tax=Helianthus annuus TaxID=4232 RepID=A0A9K3DX11_HELAN|nr:hypothetical protein HanXRQr2_Chr15g0676571 [Helianthus annuus]KAJ0829875.1 hypothetical protein HanPSC8_Chr15g0648771 [Helianthus annuus]KAJ0843222.1 hypothetical protein HanRHA438_Chr15g0688991 [Helianthus annuus]
MKTSMLVTNTYGGFTAEVLLPWFRWCTSFLFRWCSDQQRCSRWCTGGFTVVF